MGDEAAAGAGGFALSPHETLKRGSGPLLLCILDGWGENAIKDAYNAVHMAETPTMDGIKARGGTTSGRIDARLSSYRKPGGEGGTWCSLLELTAWANMLAHIASLRGHRYTAALNMMIPSIAFALLSPNASTISPRP